MTRRRALVPLLALALGALGLTIGAAAVPAATAATGSPPVTTPDAVTVLQGNGATLQPVNNDHDPDNELLALCRLGNEQYRGLSTDFFGNDWEVFAKPKAKPGTYTFTYYACDFSFLTPGTITVTVEKLPDIKVAKVAGRPGRIRVTNPVNKPILFMYGSFKEDQPDGTVRIDKGATVTLKVHRTRIDWIATSPRGDIFYGTGHLKGIALPRAAAPHTRVPLAPRLSRMWQKA